MDSAIFLNKYYSGDQIEEDEIGVGWGMWHVWRKRPMLTGF